MKTHRRACVAVALAFCAILPPALGAQSRVPAPPPMAADGSPNSTVELDRDGDGRVDFRILYDSRGKVAQEQLDFKGTGRMDTFYFYKGGVLDRVEIDTEETGKVDLWVYLINGDAVQRYERDTDGDGKPDLVRKFGG